MGGSASAGTKEALTVSVRGGLGRSAQSVSLLGATPFFDMTTNITPFSTTTSDSVMDFAVDSGRAFVRALEKASVLMVSMAVFGRGELSTDLTGSIAIEGDRALRSRSVQESGGLTQRESATFAT